MFSGSLGWVRTPLDDVARVHATWLASPGWVIDGWGNWDLMVERFTAADTIVFIDFPLSMHLWWAMKRQVACSIGLRDDWPPKGCKAFPVTFHLLRLMVRIHREIRPRLVALFTEPRFQERTVRILSPQALRQFRQQVLSGVRTSIERGETQRGDS